MKSKVEKWANTTSLWKKEIIFWDLFFSLHKKELEYFVVYKWSVVLMTVLIFFSGEACALCNLGNCHSSRNEFSQAVPFYENYLMLSQELNDIEGEAKACHFLGYAHYCLGNYKEAVRYYDQDLALARDQQDRMSMGRAYCNLGLAHLALGNYEDALECQKYFLGIL
jgi:tetratricopeptide (TPR) repeat protein